MAIAVRDSFSNNAGSGQTVTPTVTLPASVQTGDVGHLLIGTNGGTATITSEPVGWTLVSGPITNPASNLRAWLYVKSLTQAEANTAVTLTLSASGRWHIGGLVLSGATLLPEQSTSWVDNTDDLALSIPSVTPVADNAMLVVLASVRYASTTTGVTPTGGWTEHQDSNTTNGTAPLFGVWVGSRTLVGQAGIAQSAADMTYAGNARNNAWILVVAPAAVESGTPQTFASVTASGWTPEGGTALAVLSDSSDSTYLTSPDNPSESAVDLTLKPIQPPSGDFVVTLRGQSVNSTDSNLNVTLVDGSSTIATATTQALSGSLANITSTFSASSISSVSQAKWNSGSLLVRVKATADNANLTWSEEFTSLDLATTANPNGRWRPNDVWQNVEQGYTDFGSGGSTWNLNPSQTINGATRTPFSIASSVLSVTAQRTPSAWVTDITAANGGNPAPPWVGGILITNTALAANRFGYGCYGFRIRHSQPGKGMFPAAWMFAANGYNSGKENSEIDLFEIFGYSSGQPWSITVHEKKGDGTAATGATTGDGQVNVATVNTDTASWHVYALDWTPDYLRFYKDAVLVAELTGADATFFRGVTMSLRLNHAMDAAWFPTGQTSDVNTPSPMSMEVDWIRVWDKIPVLSKIDGRA